MSYSTFLAYTFKGDTEETEFEMRYDINGAEPDVGIMSEWIDDFGFWDMEGVPLSQKRCDELEADKKWMERTLADACDVDYDYYE